MLSTPRLLKCYAERQPFGLTLLGGLSANLSQLGDERHGLLIIDCVILHWTVVCGGLCASIVVYLCEYVYVVYGSTVCARVLMHVCDYM